MLLLALMFLFSSKFFTSSFKSTGILPTFPKHAKFRIQKLSSKSSGTSSTVDTKSAVVILEKGKARLFQDGNPLVYGGAIKKLEGNPSSGDLVSVTDHMGNLIGKGVYNSNSTYRVRMFTRSYEQESNLDFDSLLKLRIEQALALRKRAGLPSESNTAFRAINGEGDRLSGLIVDVFGPVVVAQSGALWVVRYQQRIEAALRSVLGSTATTYIWRQQEARLNQDGYFLSNPANKATSDSNSSSSSQSQSESDILVPENGSGASKISGNDESSPLIVSEHGVKYWVRPEDGQKTGFYCDQRDNRRLIRELSAGRSVLDTYCYSGGFSINAALGGATSVVAVDSSQAAIDTAVQNAEINKVGQTVQFVKSDAVEYMRKLQSEGKQFDIVICDPPKLAPTRASLDRAQRM